MRFLKRMMENTHILNFKWYEHAPLLEEQGTSLSLSVFVSLSPSLCLSVFLSLPGAEGVSIEQVTCTSSSQMLGILGGVVHPSCLVQVARETPRERPAQSLRAHPPWHLSPRVSREPRPDGQAPDRGPVAFLCTSLCLPSPACLRRRVPVDLDVTVLRRDNFRVPESAQRSGDKGPPISLNTQNLMLWPTETLASPAPSGELRQPRTPGPCQTGGSRAWSGRLQGQEKPDTHLLVDLEH